MMERKMINLSDEELLRALEESQSVLGELYPTTLINSREVPVCPKCGQITDIGPMGSHECSYCLREMLSELEKKPFI
jgi:hypothetical protein